jgi:hypothetical protein
MHRVATGQYAPASEIVQGRVSSYDRTGARPPRTASAPPRRSARRGMTDERRAIFLCQSSSSSVNPTLRVTW